MRKFFSFGNKRHLPMQQVPLNSPLWSGLGLGTEKTDEVAKSQPGYNIQENELKKIHRAAIVGNVTEVAWILLHRKDTIDKRDRMNRTALHLACAKGHHEVVKLLVERKCHLRLYDNEDRTALMKAVQCQEERCLTILLEHGADPNLTDRYGNTALHYAVIAENISIAEKLLLHHANIEARNEFGLTPFLLAIKINNEHMVEFLIGKKANIHAVDKSKRTALMLAVIEQSPNIVSLLLQKGINISSQALYGWTAEEYANMNGFEGYFEIIAKHREKGRLENSSQNNNPVVEKYSDEDAVISICIKPGDDIDSLPTSDDEKVDFNIKKRETQPATAKKINGLALIESAPQEQTVNETLTAADGAHKSNRHPFGLEEEDGKSSGTSESISSRLSEKNIAHFSGATEQKGPGMLNEQVEDVSYIPSGSRDFEVAKLKETRSIDIPVSHTVVEKHSEEDSISSISVKPGDDIDSRPTSEEKLDFNIKPLHHYKLLDIRKRNCASPGTPRVKPFLEDKGDSQPAIGKKINGLALIESAPQEQTVNENLTAADGAHNNNRHALGLEVEDEESPWDSESISSRLSEKNIAHFSGATEQKGPGMLNEQVEDVSYIPSGSRDFELPKLKETRSVDIPESHTALGLEVEDEESPWDSESICSSRSEKNIAQFSGTTEQKGPDVSYIPSGSRDFELPKLKETRSVDIPESHTGSLENYPYLKPTVEVIDSVSDKPVETKEKETSKSDLSDWKSTGLNSNSGTYQISRHLKVDDKCPSVSQSMTKNQSASTEFKQTTLIDKKKINDIGAVFMLENYKLHDVGESQLPENREHKEDLPPELNLEMTTEEEGERLDESENKHPEIYEEMERQQNNEMAALESAYATAAAAVGVIQHIGSGETDNHLSPIMENEDCDGVPRFIAHSPHPGLHAIGALSTHHQALPSPHPLPPSPSVCFCDPALHMKELREEESEKQTSEESVITQGFEKAYSLTSHQLQVNNDSPLSEINQDEERPAKKTSNEKEEAEEQIKSVDVHGEITEITKRDSHLHCSNYTISMSLIEQHGMGCKDSIGLLKIKDVILSYDKLVELKKNHCGKLKRKNEKLENKVNKLQKQLSETKEMTLQLELQKLRWEQELSSLRFALSQEKEERKTTEALYKIIQEELKQKREQYHKEVEMKQQLEHNLRTLDEELRTVRNDFNKISSSHENHMWQDQVAMLRLEIETINKENWEKERNYCKDIEIVKEKNVSLQKAIKRKEETLTKTISQYSGQINALTAENTMLKSKLETEKQNKERLDARDQSYQARLAAAIQDHDQSQTSKRDLELAFQRAKDEWFRVQDKLNSEVLSLKDSNELLSQNLSKAESKFNTLEVELHHTRDALREKTLVLECVQRDLGQTQCQKKEIELMYQNEQDKVSKYIGNQESLKNRLSQLQNENMLLQQQLDDAHNKSKEKIVINIRDQFQDIIKKIQTESQKQTTVMEEKNKELINECNLLKERMCEYEKEKTEREVAVRQLQGELADILKKQSMSETSLEVTSHCHRNLEDEAQVVKEKLAQLRSQVDDLIAKLETVSSKNQTLTQELPIKEIQTKYEKREESKKKLEQVENLKSSMEANIEVAEIEQYKRDLEQRARVDTEKLKQAILFLQTQVASQENLLVHLIENSATLANQMELRINGLEFEVLKMRSSQEGFNKIEVEHYRQRYLAEVELRTSLSSELNKTNEKLAETRTKLLMEKQRNQTLLDTINMRPSLHLPYGRNVDSSLLFNRTIAPQENITIPTTSSWPSNNGIETFLTKMRQELQENITRELEEAAAEFESDSFGAANFLESSCGSHPNYDVIRAMKDYEQCLKRNYKL